MRRTMSIGILILRLVVGLTLAAHGAQKLFGWFGGYGLTGTGGFLEQLGFVPGRRHALLAGLAETGAGLLLALGLLTPLAAAVALSVMVVLGVRDAGAGWGLAALVVGLAGAGLQLARRQLPAPSTVSPGEPVRGETVA